MTTRILSAAGLLAALALAAGCAAGSTTHWPDPGYAWSDPNDSADLSLRWKPGSGYYVEGQLRWPKVVASTQEGRWEPLPGYAWAHLDANGRPIPGDLAVRWTPGLKFPQQGRDPWSNIQSGNEEGLWFPEPGYVWRDLDANGKPIPGNLHVKWRPGTRYEYLGKPKWPHVVAADQEGRWKPQSGYTWANRDANGRVRDFSVVTIAEANAAKVRETPLLRRWTAYLREIQDQKDYPNWSGPPHDLYASSLSR